MGWLEKESPEKQRAGVADYFAIVGVGEDLIWNHAQAKSTNDQNSARPEEDEAMLIERFYREIVDCRIVAVEASREAYKDNALSAIQGQFVLGVPSPSLSNVASRGGTDDGEVELGGWTVLKETKPMDVDAALETTSVICNSQSRKGEVYHANLDPVSGLAEELQSSLEARLQLEQDSRMSKSTPLKDFRRKVTSSFAQRLVLADTYQKKKFYLSYRRRAPDEFSEKAISQVQLLYARVHKVTLDATIDNRSATESAVTTSTVSQKGAAALLRVAEAGKNVMQSRILGSPQIMTRGSMDIGDLAAVALETLLELPAGFDAWSIPEPYQTINLPSRHESRANQRDHQSTVDTHFASEGSSNVENEQNRDCASDWQDIVRPRIVTKASEVDESYMYIPILAIRRQRVGEEERFNEDPAIVDICVSFWNRMGEPSLPVEKIDPFDDEEIKSILLRSTEWKAAALPVQSGVSSQYWRPPAFGTNCLLFKRNLPLGFCDATFKATVLDRFPYRNYKGLPLPEEELPMFCYPTGCHLYRTRFKDVPLPQYYGFVVKNERGDSICVSCVSFMEPLTKEKKRQLRQLSARRKRASLPHSIHVNEMASGSSSAAMRRDEFPDMLTAFDEMTTFENKTICLVSRYPYWTAFRKFLSHLHSISCSSSALPLERVPMALSSPPSKDLPLVDLSYERLISCLDIPTIVAIVLGFLALEKKIIVMSSQPSLVLDVCELLRSLLFPFDLCAPYVPRLTEPFMSCLDFPGAIFVGIHDDKKQSGLAAVVRRNMPEDSTIVDLDSGSIDCSGDRVKLLQSSWEIIPQGPRGSLVSEIETLCRDVGMVPGKTTTGSDAIVDVSSATAFVDDHNGFGSVNGEPLDDRAIRDAFLRFFCSIMGGYERYLVVPDADFLVSGEDWFDSKGFVSSVSEDKAPYLGLFVSTQLFQAYIQRRTEASDVHCLLFDECVVEYHSSISHSPYGRLGSEVETLQSHDDASPQLLYSLLVDQSASEARLPRPEIIGDTDSKHGSESDSSAQHSEKTNNGDFALNSTGDLVTVPSARDIPDASRFVYCIDGNTTFPDRLNADFYFPREPESWLVEMSTAPTPMLTRSEQEIEEADRRQKLAISSHGLQSQRRCLWQFPKLMGSHFLGAWLLCMPTFVAQNHISHQTQSKYLLYALGGLRLLRGKRRIVPDEAAYRALIVACGRTKSDRRMELVKIFGLLRSDGIFPSAVTLGQYTRALAEGYSKRSIGTTEESMIQIDDPITENVKSEKEAKTPKVLEPGLFLSSLDSNLNSLEEAGRRWRQNKYKDQDPVSSQFESALNDTSQSVLVDQIKRRSNKPWLPVSMSSSFLVDMRSPESVASCGRLEKESIRLVAIWSRTQACEACGYILFDEEIQAGWDAIQTNDTSGSVKCPRCRHLYMPMLGYKEFSIEEALTATEALKTPGDRDNKMKPLPPQMGSVFSHTDAAYVTYISPASMRLSLEKQIKENGEGILERDTLKRLDPQLYYNLWWYSARFSLPLPLPVSDSMSKHYCAFAAWDYNVAVRACHSCARVLYPFSTERQTHHELTIASAESLGDDPLLSKFNLQGYFSHVWDHEDLSGILVCLVEACDKRDFKPAIECLIGYNERRRKNLALHSTNKYGETKYFEGGTVVDQRDIEYDLYRTILYLAKYQCTTAFHVFFPATLKPCKGYHFWCPVAPIPIFDRLFRDGLERIRSSKQNAHHIANARDVSDVALAFRSVFGHIV
ncbi:unnamed protein product [Cylindrotheca closterium]|uniref:UDENN domain-containing protein n=1 Tax=Cylindrotheca closterium TaxID=2856 RepID=A0AAD2JKZ0_9STRA|nr:unnamed protein product [Cylindrotheca closterium]